MHKNQDSTICCYKKFTSTVKTYIKKGKSWKIEFQANGNPKQGGVAILVSKKIEFKPKIVRKEKESPHIMIK